MATFPAEGFEDGADGAEVQAAPASIWADADDTIYSSNFARSGSLAATGLGPAGNAGWLYYETSGPGDPIDEFSGWFRWEGDATAYWSYGYIVYYGGVGVYFSENSSGNDREVMIEAPSLGGEALFTDQWMPHGQWFQIKLTWDPGANSVTVIVDGATYGPYDMGASEWNRPYFVDIATYRGAGAGAGGLYVDDINPAADPEPPPQARLAPLVRVYPIHN